MQINSIEMTNWKCFEHKKVDFPDNLTLLNWKNGEGKTSLIEAIVLCLFDKRPDNLDYASLVDITKTTKLILHFTHNATTYVVEREVGKSSAYKLFKNEELIGRTNKECKEELRKLIPESVLTSLWGYDSLAKSAVLSSSYLYSILENEFQEPLELRQHFVSDKSYYQKLKSSLEKTITNQKVTQEQLDSTKKELEDIEDKLKSKAFISDSEVIKAKKAKEDKVEYDKVKAQLDTCLPFTYTRDECIRLKDFGKTQEEWDAYFANVKDELEKEKSKSAGSPLIKYPKNTISQLINESKCNNNTCILCGGKFVEPKLDYDTIDNAKIKRLEDLLREKEENHWNFKSLVESMKYWHYVKLLEPLKYVENYDYQSVLDKYDAETNTLYSRRDQLKREYEQMDKDLAKINELLATTKAYDQDKECIDIVDEYVAEAKEFYAREIVNKAKETLKSINTRYTDLFIENGIYKVRLWDKDFKEEKVLAVQSLSNGEKTIVALSLIMTIKNMFMPGLPLIMDESFANLDADNINSINNLIHEDTNKSNQWIIVSHDERLL